MACCKSQRSTNDRGLRKCFVLFMLLCSWAGFLPSSVKADDGYRLWLRYEPLPSRSLNMYRQLIKSIAVHGKSATFDAIRYELRLGAMGQLGSATMVDQDRVAASVVVGLPETSPFIRRLRW